VGGRVERSLLTKAGGVKPSGMELIMRFLIILMLVLSGPVFAKGKGPPSKRTKIQSNNQQSISDSVQSSSEKADSPSRGKH